ncbi:hypothetical protein C9374_000306 [Naegleria lovaniensis]|uniref:SP-RING-type domain-containing protein n=1 Tax=Naegleria lovaniensis TaxID=51637 RepID=A0AA88GU06_NAELO|nr:uncharacterized protein C9374_000306 [Naegleria lovaniensis]KAG2388867.1 hypothetical protein C9374_000306 [Naegleria lovaniensis]
MYNRASSSGNSLLKQTLEPLILNHNKQTETVYGYIGNITELAKEIESLHKPGDPEYDSLQEHIQQLDGCVREYLDMLRISEGHTKTLQQIVESNTSDLSKLEETYDRLSKANTAKPLDDDSIKQDEMYQTFRLEVLRVHDPTGELDWNKPQDDDEIMLTQQTLVVTCPWTRTHFNDPIECIRCHHFYEKSEAISRIRKHGYIDCPVAGCSEKRILEANLKPNPKMAYRIKQEIARIEKEKREKAAQQAVELTDD